MRRYCGDARRYTPLKKKKQSFNKISKLKSKIMEEIMNWISTNKTWIFSGAGVAIILGIIRMFRNKKSTVSNTATGSGNIQAGRDINIQKEEKKN